MTHDRILIVDGVSKSVHLLRQILTGAGYAALVTNKGEQAIQIVAEEQPALVLTDSYLPGDIDGYALVRRIREFSDIPVIILSASAETGDILHGFEAGADDYISKPFDSKILLARVKAVLKRCAGDVATPVEIICDNLVINQASRQVTLNGLHIYLTETEYNLLLELARHHNKVMLHEQLLMAVWGPQFRNDVNYLRSYIHILRRKLESDPTQPQLIISRPGIGYMLVSNPAEGSGK
jgi:two-component system KDP operon response regulator KdpE